MKGVLQPLARVPDRRGLRCPFLTKVMAIQRQLLWMSVVARLALISWGLREAAARPRGACLWLGPNCLACFNGRRVLLRLWGGDADREDVVKDQTGDRSVLSEAGLLGQAASRLRSDEYSRTDDQFAPRAAALRPCEGHVQVELVDPEREERGCLVATAGGFEESAGVGMYQRSSVGGDGDIGSVSLTCASFPKRCGFDSTLDKEGETNNVALGVTDGDMEGPREQEIVPLDTKLRGNHACEPDSLDGWAYCHEKELGFSMFLERRCVCVRVCAQSCLRLFGFV